MKCKVVLGLLALIVTLVLSATAAQAGQGGQPSALTSFFACYSINGKDAEQTVDIENAVESPACLAIGNRDCLDNTIGHGSRYV